MGTWNKFKCPITELCLDIVLKCGQSFRWTKYSEKEWIGVMKDKVWILTQSETEIFYKVFNSNDHNVTTDKIENDSILRDYFQLEVNLNALYKQWKKSDKIFEKLSDDFPGVRILRQDPVENLFSFICSSNNNISRISGMVEKLCTCYGSEVATVNGITYKAFPKIEKLAQKGVEENLRKLGFGYRAGYISKSAKQLFDKGGEKWLLSLRNSSYLESKAALMTLTGIGPKVADCICLMSLDQTSAIPVDTHMFQIASKFYLPHLRNSKTVTTKVYNEISQLFQELFGEYSGWAHSVLFSSDLKHLQNEDSNASLEKKNVAEKTKKKSKKRKNCDESN